MHDILPRYKRYLIGFILVIGVFLRFYNLNWGSPFYFHPDERNIASSITQLEFPSQMNPHFFAYGSFPLYSIYFLGVAWNWFDSIMNQANSSSFITQVPFERAILVSRFFSAFFSFLLLLLLYRVIYITKGEQAAWITVILASLSVGFIQFSHFGTFEMWLAFFSLLLFFTTIKLLNSNSFKHIFVNALIFGILVSIKISSLALFPLPILALIMKNLRGTKTNSDYIALRNIVFAYVKILCFIGISLFFYVITNPYLFFDTSAFLGAIKYESSVALGTLSVFYTGSFYETIPIVFQFTKVYPFLINPLLTIMFIPSFVYIIYQVFIRKNVFYLLLSTFYLLLFFSHAFFFVKWTRYMVPTLPFMYLIISIAIADFLVFITRRNTLSIKYYVLCVIIVTSFIFAISYTITVYGKKDSRIATVDFAREHILWNATILSEVYDMGITPFNPYFYRIDLFNFYDLDPVESYRSSPGTIRTRLTERFDGAGHNISTPKQNELTARLSSYDYIILPSQRILRSRFLNSLRFPEGNKFYQAIFSGRLGFEKIYETPCDLFCKITYLGDPIFSVEETANVFDRPTVFIFKRK